MSRFGEVTLGAGIAMTLFCAALGFAAPALADPVRGLPDGWSMADDASYAPGDKRWRYKPPPPRRGTYAHGTSGELPAEEGVDAMEAAKACFARGADFRFADAPGEEYWYFESAGEGLLLLKTNLLRGYDADCKPMIGATYSFKRALIGKDGFTSFEKSDTGWSSETRRFAEFRRSDIDDIVIGNRRPALTRFAVRKRRLGDSDVGERIGKVRTHCVGYSSPPDAGGSQCWIAGPGPGKGMIVWDAVVEMGSQQVYQAVSEVEDGVALDGRLFEWDRAIAPKD